MTGWWRAFDILRVLRGERLECGCLVGIYETFAGKTARILDVVGPACRVEGHQDGARLDERRGGRRRRPRAARAARGSPSSRAARFRWS